MRSGPDQRPRGRFNANRPFKQQPRTPQNSQTFDSNGPNIKIRGSAYQIFERYLALAREATASGDRIAAENLYQHAEHYFRINNARRDGNQQGTPPRPTTPADVEMNSSEADSGHFIFNEYYPTEEEFLFALADAVHEEYRAVVAAGFVLQIDDPGLPDWWDMLKPEPTVESYRRFARLRIDAVNRALAGIPEDRVRYHLCWGSWHGPHTHDLPL